MCNILICLTMVDFPDSPAPIRVKNNLQLSSIPRRRSLCVDLKFFFSFSINFSICLFASLRVLASSEILFSVQQPITIFDFKRDIYRNDRDEQSSTTQCITIILHELESMKASNKSESEVDKQRTQCSISNTFKHLTTRSIHVSSDLSRLRHKKLINIQ